MQGQDFGKYDYFPKQTIARSAGQVLQHNKPDEDLQRKIYIYVFQFDANN
jgi:hypothetical protein